MTHNASSLLREWRGQRSLEQACDLFEQRGFQRPSIAKLWRMEREQKVPEKDLRAVAEVTGIPIKELRPDLAEMFGGER